MHAIVKTCTCVLLAWAVKGCGLNKSQFQQQQQQQSSSFRDSLVML